MGNIFPLSEKPSCFKSTLRLIEKSFQYQSPYKFEIDFAPLINQSNHANCFIYVDENENVLAHLGVKERKITLNRKTFSIFLLGGIAVDEKRRGEGIFQALMQEVLSEKRSDSTFFLLWSDLEKLYKKFGFYLCGSQFEIASQKVESPFIKTSYDKLNEDEKKQVRELYVNSFCKLFRSLDRDSGDWELIEKVTSAALFIQKHHGRIESYYFQNKGQDLPEVIYEYGTKKEINTFLREISSYGKVWMGAPLIDTDISQYQFMMCPGDMKLFTDFINEFTKDQFTIRNINMIKQEVFFDFDEETLVLSVEDFLRGVFGPGQFEELGEIHSFFISGLDSI